MCALALPFDAGTLALFCMCAIIVGEVVRVRRTIDLPQDLEDGVRRVQIALMEREKRTVSFNEALAVVVSRGLGVEDGKKEGNE